jgi:hypothetical protein
VPKLGEDKLRTGAVVFVDKPGAFADQMSDYLDYFRNSGKYIVAILKLAVMTLK